MAMNINQFNFISKCVIINNQDKFLIIKRTNYKNDGTKDLWDFPGGNVELYEDVNVAIKREVKEEVQINVNNLKVLRIDSGKQSLSIPFIFVLYYTRDYNLENKIILSHEHSEYKWISINEINNYDFYLEDYRLETIKNYLK